MPLHFRAYSFKCTLCTKKSWTNISNTEHTMGGGKALRSLQAGCSRVDNSVSVNEAMDPDKSLADSVD